MILDSIIDRYKNFRKQSYLSMHSSYRSKYAFVGVGNHSISNLYPCVQYLAVPLKYICTKRIANAENMAARFKDATGTSNIDDILNDKEVKGVFISTQPSTHFELAKKCLAAGKDIFIEKPPCYHLNELKELIKVKGSQVCVIGLQKRYSAVNKVLRGKNKNVQSYNYKYLTGPYPEGNEVLDLFIHPVDNVVFLFGPAKLLHVSKIKMAHGITFFLHTEHASGIKGTIELSTNYTWSMPADTLTVNTPGELFIVKYPNYTLSQKKPPVILNIPLEKVMKYNSVQETHFSNSGFVPTKEFNSLNIQGYLPEVETFVKLVEKQPAVNLSSPETLINTFELLDQLAAT